MSSTCQPLPAAWVERIFERMSLAYGVQKTASMWTGVDPESVKSAWGDALGRFPRDALSAAVLSVQDAHPSWPPTLGEFCALVASKVPAPEHRRALPVPRRSAEDIAAGREQMERVKALLKRAVRRPEDAQRAPEPACTCMVGQQRAQTLCEACAAFAAARLRRVSA